MGGKGGGKYLTCTKANVFIVMRFWNPIILISETSNHLLKTSGKEGLEEKEKGERNQKETCLGAVFRCTEVRNNAICLHRSVHSIPGFFVYPFLNTLSFNKFSKWWRSKEIHYLPAYLCPSSWIFHIRFRALF